MNTATRTNTKGEEFLANKGLQRAKNDRAWDWVREIADNVRKSMQGPAIIMPMINDDVLCAKVAEQGNLSALIELVNRLGADVQSYVTRYQRLYGRHSQRRGPSCDPDDLMASIKISQDYTQFCSSWESVIMPTILEILEILEKAGLNTKSIYAASDMKLVYSMYDQAPSPTSE